ncbi:MAG: beta-class carbonic anhydrase [Promethearchaeota archaeon]
MNKTIEDILINGNFRYQWQLHEMDELLSESGRPRLSTLILTCMDPRIDIYKIFDLKPGDVFVLRNAGNIITEDVERALYVAIFRYDIRNIIILGHVDCGMAKLGAYNFVKNELPKPIVKRIIKYSSSISYQSLKFFKPIKDEIMNIKNQIEKIKEIKGLPRDLKVTGMLYDVDTGWVFDFNTIRFFKNMKEFYHHYSSLVARKRERFVDLILDLVPDSMTNNEQPEQSKEEIKIESTPALRESESNEINKAQESYYSELESDVNTKMNNLINLYEQNIEKASGLSQKIIIPKVRIPKIYIPKVKIYSLRNLNKKRMEGK